MNKKGKEFSIILLFKHYSNAFCHGCKNVNKVELIVLSDKCIDSIWLLLLLLLFIYYYYYGIFITEYSFSYFFIHI